MRRSPASDGRRRVPRAGAAPDGSPDRHARVEAELVRIVCRFAPPGFVAGTVVTSLAAVLLWGVVPPRRVVAWVLVMGMVTTPAFLAVWRFPRATLRPDEAETWRRRLMIAFGLAGLGWGAGGIMLFPSHSAPHQMLVIFVVSGMAAGGMSVHGALPSVFAAYSLTAVLPLTARLMIADGEVPIFMAVTLLAFEGGLLVMASHFRRALAESVELRFQNLELIDRLSTARDQADGANRAKSQFLANMSHELRTPLHGVLGMLELLLHGRLGDRQRRLAQSAFRSGQAQLAIVNDLLDFAKIEAGKLELEVVEVELRQLVDEVVELFAEVARRKGFELAYVIHDDVPRQVRGDPGRLRQILTNLVGNAVKFTDAGGVLIRVSLLAGHAGASPDEHAVLFAVRDTGVGIPPAVQSRVFEAFAQADGSMARRYGGTGLGLSVARQLVRMMGGEIWVESRPGNGSTFSFTVPMPASRLHRSPATRAPGTTGALAPAESGPLGTIDARVLLVEDNPVNQEVTAAMLETAGCTVEVVADGRAALERVATTAYDLVLMDCQIPELDGFETARVIREREAGGSRALPRIPIIALTANALRGDRERCLAAGMNDYLSKPFNSGQLREVLHRWIRADGLGAEERTVRHRAPLAMAMAEEDPLPLGEGPIDPDTLDRIRALSVAGGHDVLGKVVRVYLDSSTKLLQALHVAEQRGDGGALCDAAHALKSSSASVGALKLAALCSELETMGRTRRLADAGPKLGEADSEYATARAALIKELDVGVAQLSQIG